MPLLFARRFFFASAKTCQRILWKFWKSQTFYTNWITKRRLWSFKSRKVQICPIIKFEARNLKLVNIVFIFISAPHIHKHSLFLWIPVLRPAVFAFRFLRLFIHLHNFLFKLHSPAVPYTFSKHLHFDLPVHFS